MSKVYLTVSLNLIVDTDLTNIDDIMEGINIEAYGNGETDDETEVYDCEIESAEVTESK